MEDLRGTATTYCPFSLKRLEERALFKKKKKHLSKMTSGPVRAARDGQSESEGIWAGSAGCEGVMLRMATTNTILLST